MRKQIFLVIMIQFMMAIWTSDSMSIQNYSSYSRYYFVHDYDDSLIKYKDEFRGNPLHASSFMYARQNIELVNSVLEPSSNQNKSPEKAFLLSAIVPGTGELYAGSLRGIAFIATETTFWISYFILQKRADEINNSYLDAVRKNIRFEDDSPVKSTDTWTLEDFEHATQSDNWHYVYTEDNGRPIPRVGKFYWADAEETKDEPAGELVNNSKLRQQAYRTRMSANKKYKQAKKGLGLVVVNHIISAIDARILAINRNKRDTKISIHNNILPSGETTIIMTLKKPF